MTQLPPACGALALQDIGRSIGPIARAALLALTALAVAGCTPQKPVPPPTPPAPTFTGPAFLHGTVGSLCQLHGSNFQPILVSNYGLVVNLQGTGSAEVPQPLRQRMLTELRRHGVPRAEAVLADPNTAVVEVYGLIPPGAVAGSTFDLYVRALDGTQTTSLEGGRLWTIDMGVQGTNLSITFTRPLAQGSGAMYLNPFEDATAQAQTLEFQRQAVVLSGGTVRQSRELDLVLNQPSWHNSSLIAQRINERFYKGPEDRDETAVAKTDAYIELHVPRRFAREPERFLMLLSHLYLQRTPNFEPEQAKRLGEVLVADPGYAKEISLAWQALGKTCLDVVRSYYQHEQMPVRLAALEAGARLADEQAALVAESMVTYPDTGVRRQVAAVLAHLPSSLRGAQALQRLLSDEDRAVRIAAYKALAAIGDPIIDSHPMTVPHEDGKPRLKFVLDLVPSDKPLIFISQTKLPRLVIFSPNLGFKRPMLARLWDNRLMLRLDKDDQKLSVFYQAPGKTEPNVQQIAPALGSLAFLMGASAQDPKDPTPPLDLSYSQVVNAVHRLCQQGFIEAPVELEVSPLVAQISRRRLETSDEVRPETGEPATAPATQPGQ